MLFNLYQVVNDSVLVVREHPSSPLLLLSIAEQVHGLVQVSLLKNFFYYVFLQYIVRETCVYPFITKSVSNGAVPLFLILSPNLESF